MPDPILETTTVEVCVDSVQGAIAAERGGADRIELCCALSEGGLTPSLGMVARVRDRVQLPIFMMVRPRPGDFCYDDNEIAVMKRDLAEAKAIGVNGAVFGVLRTDAGIAKDSLRRLIDCARPLAVTFHRAFDFTPDPDPALDTLIELGVERILTSGQAASAPEGLDLITHLIEHAGGRITVVPGGGIREENIADVISRTRAREVHFTAGVRTESPMRFPRVRIPLGSSDSPSDHELKSTSEARVREFLRRLSPRDDKRTPTSSR